MKRILLFILGWGLYSQNVVEEWKTSLGQNDPGYQRILLENQTNIEAYYDSVFSSLWPSVTLAPSLTVNPTAFSESGFDWVSGASLTYSQPLPYVGTVTATVQPSVVVSSESGVSSMSMSTSIGVSQTFLPDFSQDFFQPSRYDLTKNYIEQSESLRLNRLARSVEFYTLRKLQEYFFLSIAEQQKQLYRQLLDWYSRLEKDLDIRLQQGVLNAVELQERLSGRRDVLTYLENIHFTLVSFGSPIFPEALLDSNQMSAWLSRLEASFRNDTTVSLFELDEHISMDQADLGYLQAKLGWAAIGFSFSTNFTLSGSTNGFSSGDIPSAWDNLINQNWARNWSWSLSLSLPLMPYDPAYRLHMRREIRKSDYLANLEQLKLQFDRSRQLRHARNLELAQQVTLRERLMSLERDRLELLRVKLTQGKSTPLEVEYQEIQTLLAELSEIQLRGTRFFSGVVP